MTRIARITFILCDIQFTTIAHVIETIRMVQEVMAFEVTNIFTFQIINLSTNIVKEELVASHQYNFVDNICSSSKASVVIKVFRDCVSCLAYTLKWYFSLYLLIIDLFLFLPVDVLGTIGAVSFGNGTVSTMFVMFLAVLAATASVMQKLEQSHTFYFETCYQ